MGDFVVSSPGTEDNGIELSFDKVLADTINNAFAPGLPVILTGSMFCGKSLAMERLRATGAIPSSCAVLELRKHPLNGGEKSGLRETIARARGVVEGSPYHFQYLAAPQGRFQSPSSRTSRQFMPVE